MSGSPPYSVLFSSIAAKGHSWAINKHVCSTPAGEESGFLVSCQCLPACVHTGTTDSRVPRSQGHLVLGDSHLLMPRLIPLPCRCVVGQASFFLETSVDRPHPGESVKGKTWKIYAKGRGGGAEAPIRS